MIIFWDSIKHDEDIIYSVIWFVNNLDIEHSTCNSVLLWHGDFLIKHHIKYFNSHVKYDETEVRYDCLQCSNITPAMLRTR